MKPAMKTTSLKSTRSISAAARLRNVRKTTALPGSNPLTLEKGNMTMKDTKLTVLAGLCCALGLGLLPALAFDSGSTGSYGAINITTDTTLDMPSNGVFNCTTITVASGKTLRFNRNPLNTPVYLLATGDVTINGTINVSGSSSNAPFPGAGGPGGFDGGYGGSGGTGNQTAGDGLGPGGGKNGISGWGCAAFAANGSSNTNKYGNSWLMPLIGGSGGAGNDGNPGLGGAGGGGAILIASNTRITNSGSVFADGASPGGYTYNGAGSGGAIRLVSPLVAGGGVLYTRAGSAYFASASAGRIRIDCPDNYSWRQLQISGASTRGSRMVVFPPVVPRLDIIQAAGQSIPEGSANGVQIQLPVGSPTNQLVTVQARDFTNNVPIRVVVTPVNGSSTNFDATIDMSAGNPSSTNLNVVIPAGSICNINAWTR
jgi:hypothetical protein